MAVLAGGVRPLAGRVAVMAGGASVGIVGASSMMMSVIGNKHRAVLEHERETI